MNEDFEHEYTHEIICPYCGYEHSNSWERSEDEGEIICSDCSKIFKYSRDITIDYSTEKI